MVSMVLSGCAGTQADSSLGKEYRQSTGSTAGSAADPGGEDTVPALGQLADFFIKAADDYGAKPERSDVLEGMEENAQATRLQMFVIAGRAFGSLPAPSGIALKAAAPAADLSFVPEWAQEALQNLSEAGLLASSDLGLAEDGEASEDAVGDKMGAAVTLKEAQILAARFYAFYGTNLKDDFYHTVNKKDLDGLEIPAGETTAGGSSAVTANTNRQLHDLMMEIVGSAETYPQGSPEQKIRTLYYNVMDVKAREQAGIEPLRKYLDSVDAAGNFSELNAAIAECVKELGNFGNGLFPMVAVTDTKDSSRYIMQVMTMPAALAESDYENPESEMLKTYRESMIRQLVTVGEGKEEAERLADAVINMESRLAGQVTDPEELGDLQRETKRYTPALLDELMPEAKPSQLLKAIGLKENVQMQVFDDKQFEAYADWFTEDNLEIFKALQKMALLTGFSKYLSDELAIEFGYGTETTEETANNAVQTFLSEELGQLYVSRYFSSEAKADIEKMVKMMVEVYKGRIEKLEWMEETTKQEALKKLDSLTVLIGYPDEWQFNGAEFKSAAEGGSYFANAAATEAANWKSAVEKLDQPVSARRFPLAAYTVNAAASRNTNTIIFPAGILQAPFYDKNASFEENLGSIGSTIAHEITHMFDDGGAQYDAKGNVRNWWTEGDFEHFQQLCAGVESFYEGWEAVPGVAVNGKETLSENISDIGGIACGLEILSQMENPDYDAFFRSFARQWTRVGDRETLAELAQTDFHAPNNLRCNRVLANFQEFYDTYGIEPGDGMYVAPEDRIKIW